MCRRVERIARWLLALPVFLSLYAEPAHAQDIPPPEEGQDLYLEVFVNGQPRNLIARFTDIGDGVLSADAEDLRTSGILAGDAMSGEVRLDQIPGLGWRLLTSEQTIRFIVPPDIAAPHEIDAGAAAETAATESGAEPQVDRGYGVVLNYGLNLESWRGDRQTRGQLLSGSFDGRLFMPLGVLNHGFVIAPDGDGAHRYRRLDTSWRSSLPGRMLQLQLGDIASRGPSWARPVRMGGAMVERNFGLQPDLVTIPLAGFEGSAALPSTVEVFSDSIRTYSADVPAGPFSIRDLPMTSGSGVARVVLRDVTGRETLVDLPFLVSDLLLKPGLADFAVSVGQPRLGIGTASDRYGNDIFGVGTLRYGVTDALTVSAHAEGGRGLQMAGAGAVFRVGHWGTASIGLAGSRSDRGSGALLDMASRLSFGSATLSGRLTRTQGRFDDVAAVSATPRGEQTDRYDFPRQIAQMSFSMPLDPSIGSGASLFLSDIQSSGPSDRETSLGVSYSRRLWRDSSVTVTATSSRGARRDTTAGVQLQIPLGNRHYAGLQSERRQGGWRHFMQASGQSETHNPRWNWRVQADQGDGRSLRASAGYENQLGQIEVAARTQSDNHAVGLRVQGAVVASGGGIFLSRPVQDAFAVVDVGAPGVEVSSENRAVGRTGRSGRILVPDLRAYEENAISIDPLGLPIDAATEATQRVVRPAHRSGSTVTFGVQARTRDALIGLVDSRGQPLEVGGRVILNETEGDALVGFDGETFLTDLQDRNLIEVSYPDGRRCRAAVAYVDEPGVLTHLREVPCL